MLYPLLSVFRLPVLSRVPVLHRSLRQRMDGRAHPWRTVPRVRCGAVLGVLLLGGGLVSCGPRDAVTGDAAIDQPEVNADVAPTATIEASADRPQVVTTVNILCDLIGQLTQATDSRALTDSPGATNATPSTPPPNATDSPSEPLINLTCLLDRNQDPHVYQPTPSDRRILADADLILYGGYGLEAGLIQLITASGQPTIAVYEQAVPQPLQGSDSHNHGDDHGHGDEEPGAAGHGDGEDEAAERSVPDPHIWHDAAHGGAIVAVLAQELAAIVPNAADTLQTRASELQTELNSLDRWIQTQIDTIPTSQRTLISTHDAFRYFGQAYGLETWGILSGLNPNQKPTAADLAILAERIQDSAVPLIFAEQGMDSSILETVAQTAGVAVGPVPLGVESLGEVGSDLATYQQFLVANTCAIVTGLGGTCSPQPGQ